MREPIDVLLVEDHPIVAEGLRLTLSRHPDLRVVATGATMAEGIRLATELRPDVVLLDQHLPDGSGADAARAIRAAAPATVLVMLTADTSDDAMLGAIDAGVSGYLVKSAAIVDIADALRRAAAGEMLIPVSKLTGLLGRQRQRSQRDAAQHALRQRLTPRETEVLQLMARGLDNTELAARLGITVATVRVHVQSVIEKLEAHSRLEAVVRANDHGLVDR